MEGVESRISGVTSTCREPAYVTCTRRGQFGSDVSRDLGRFPDAREPP
jgi:hypothetical protein